MTYIKGRQDIDQTSIFVIGQSLGAANALYLLGRHDFSGVRGIVADSSFFSYRQIVSDKLGELPLISYLRNPLSFLVVKNSRSPEKAIESISPTPLVIIHGTADEIIPVYHAKWLFEKAGPPKNLWIVPEGRHLDAFGRLKDAYIDQTIRFFHDAKALDESK